MKNSTEVIELTSEIRVGFKTLDGIDLSLYNEFNKNEQGNKIKFLSSSFFRRAKLVNRFRSWRHLQELWHSQRTPVSWFL
jgi:hypothetical protein